MILNKKIALPLFSLILYTSLTMAQNIIIGEAELIYTDNEMPIRYDGSLSTIRWDDQMHDTRDVAIINNEVITTDKSPVTRQAYSSIILKNCEDITIDSLSIKNPQKELKAIVEIDKNCESGDNIKAQNLTLDMADNDKRIIDNRIK
ncbi:MAG: hypothetical protein ABFS32_10255 [Bacteroidota bacterium]